MEPQTGKSLALAAVGLTAIVSVYSVLRSRYTSTTSTPLSKIIESPLSKIRATLSKAEQDKLPYPPDSLPGARDVSTPYGRIRAYEWGPEDGQKVLLVHGISTPCVALFEVADQLVEKGCRVILFGKNAPVLSNHCAFLC